MSRDERPEQAPPSSRPSAEEGAAAGDAGDAGGAGDANDASEKKSAKAKKRGAKKGRAKGAGARGAGDAPPFAASYPDDAALGELVRAFQAGDYGRVRREAPTLAARSDDPEVARAARDLRARLDPDALTLGIFWGTAALLAFLSAWAYGHGH